MNLKTLFKLDIEDHNTLVGGWMGISHGLITAGMMWLVLVLIKSSALAVLVGAGIAYIFTKKETLNFKQWNRSRDSLLDYMVPIAVVIVGSIMML